MRVAAHPYQITFNLITKVKKKRLLTLEDTKNKPLCYNLSSGCSHDTFLCLPPQLYVTIIRISVLDDKSLLNGMVTSILIYRVVLILISRNKIPIVIGFKSNQCSNQTVYTSDISSLNKIFHIVNMVISISNYDRYIFYHLGLSLQHN